MKIDKVDAAALTLIGAGLVVSAGSYLAYRIKTARELEKRRQKIAAIFSEALREVMVAILEVNPPALEQTENDAEQQLFDAAFNNIIEDY